MFLYKTMCKASHMSVFLKTCEMIGYIAHIIIIFIKIVCKASHTVILL